VEDSVLHICCQVPSRPNNVVSHDLKINPGPILPVVFSWKRSFANSVFLHSNIRLHSTSGVTNSCSKRLEFKDQD